MMPNTLHNALTRSVYAFALFTALYTNGCTKRSHQATQTTHDGNAEQALPELTVEALSGMIDRGETVAVFDANNRSRYEEGHIPGATHVVDRTVGADILPADRATPLVFYCHNEH